MERILCEEYEHIDLNIEKCPRCDSLNFYIHEYIHITDFCEGIHERDLFSCLKCDANISIDLLMRLNEAERRVKTEGV